MGEEVVFVNPIVPADVVDCPGVNADVCVFGLLGYCVNIQALLLLVNVILSVVSVLFTVIGAEDPGLTVIVLGENVKLAWA